MSNFEPRHSQMLARIPVDQVPATLIVHDGERLDGTLLLDSSGDVSRVFTDKDRFVPVRLTAGVRLVARDAISCITVTVFGPPLEHELPQHAQSVRVHLRCGVAIQGEVRWFARAESRRTSDYLNHDAPYVAVHDRGQTSYIAKAHIAWVEER